MEVRVFSWAPYRVKGYSMSKTPKIHLHKGDLPEGLSFSGRVAVDTESMGLLPQRDRLCLVQLSAGDGECHLVQLGQEIHCPRLISVLEDHTLEKVFHYARADMGMFLQQLGVMTTPVFCTKIASKLVRTYTDRHSFKYLMQELLGVEVSKEQQTSDWGADELTKEQQLYAAMDVFRLLELRDILEERLIREGRLELAHGCFDFLACRTYLDALGYEAKDPFDYK